MKFSNKALLKLFTLLIMLNIIMRLQIVSGEIGLGSDSVMLHMTVNSISEFGYAKWVLHPLSFVGMYPYSTESAIPFFLSGIYQCTGIEMRWVIFLYCILIGLLSMFTAYLMAGAIYEDDAFKIVVALVFSTSPAVLGYSTWTIAARGLFIVLAPLLVYMLLKCRGYARCIPLTIAFVMFLYATHHLVYFLIPVFFVFCMLLVLSKSKEYVKFAKIPMRFAPSITVSEFARIKKNNPAVMTLKTNLIVVLRDIVNLKPDSPIGDLKSKLNPIISIAGFAIMFSIPFLGHKFVEESVYSPIYISYMRYMGLLTIPAVGGLVYMIFKHGKSFEEWFLLLCIMFLTALIYEQTYMKWFLPIFAAPFMGIGLVNILRSKQKKCALSIVSILLLISLSFSGYYQFLCFLPTHGINERYMEDSTYTSGKWMKEYVNGSVISNDMLFGYRMGATSDTVHHLTEYTLLSVVYGFIEVDTSQFEYNPITSEEFWLNAGKMKRDMGETVWNAINKLDHTSPYEYNVSYVAENTKAMGNVIWHHGIYPSKLLYHAYDNAHCVYDCGKVNIWKLPEE